MLGLGRQAAPFMQQMGAPPNDGEVLVIEVDGKCPPTATEQELSKRRGKRQTCEGVLLRLPAASRQGEAKGPGEQETPEKRGQEQERQRSDGGRDVHVAA